MRIGAQKILKDISDLGEVDLYKAAQEAINIVWGAAVMLCPSHDGELRGSIRQYASAIPGGFRAVCYTNKEYAPYVEFGTGPRGQADHSGISPEVSVAYSQSPWWIHEGYGDNEVDRATGETYGWYYIDTPDGRFYRCAGQPASPFLYPALKDHEEEIIRIFDRCLEEAL